jgi:CHAD domain-containing protein
MRKLAKRARYTADTVATYMSGRRRSSLGRFAKRIAAVQSVFGRHQDATVARDRLTTIAHEDFALDGPMSLRIGRLVEKADQNASALRRASLRTWNKTARELSSKWPRE